MNNASKNVCWLNLSEKLFNSNYCMCVQLLFNYKVPELHKVIGAKLTG